ncbi:hypothetical protein ACQKJZ_14650 [Sphingomonas sp. NPDC019816]|uniref:hypothetical protein n=1 Tax=Sphingomonas sp. NPDC019816 TaxID=3390679 RepID=UPI003D0583B9
MPKLAYLLTTVDWLDVVRTAASVVTACLAYVALKNWRRQDKAKREAEFLDALIEATHAFIVDMAKPVTMVEMARIGMRSHGDDWDNQDENGAIAHGAVAYIDAWGERDSKRLFDALNEVRPGAIRLRSLGTKGQVFEFSNYRACHQAITSLVWQFDRIEAFAGMIGSTSWNWRNPHVRASLDKVLTITPGDLQQHLGSGNVAVLTFAQTTYRTLYRR